MRKLFLIILALTPVFSSFSAPMEKADIAFIIDIQSRQAGIIDLNIDANCYGTITTQNGKTKPAIYSQPCLNTINFYKQSLEDAMQYCEFPSAYAPSCKKITRTYTKLNQLHSQNSGQKH